MRRTLLTALFLFVSLTSCKRSSTNSSFHPPAQPTVAAQLTHKIEGCSLITKEEVGGVQATTVTDAKSSEGSDGSHLITQCYYATTGPNLSVSIAVTQPDPANPTGRSARELWEQSFGRFEKDGEANEAEEKKEQKREAREEEERRPPKKIEGVGEKAFWAGSKFGGALYVLKGDVFIRVSVGGPDNEETKVEKSKTLAQKALSRLP